MTELENLVFLRSKEILSCLGHPVQNLNWTRVFELYDEHNPCYRMTCPRPECAREFRVFPDKNGHFELSRIGEHHDYFIADLINPDLTTEEDKQLYFAFTVVVHVNEPFDKESFWQLQKSSELLEENLCLKFRSLL